jgi:hypothetical protein
MRKTLRITRDRLSRDPQGYIKINARSKTALQYLARNDTTVTQLTKMG